MDREDFFYYLNKTDKVVYYLENPPNTTSLCSRISRFVSNIFIHIARFFNYIFGDHHWYNELKARSIVEFYINHHDAFQNNVEMRDTMVTIKNLLVHLPDGNGGSYGDHLNLPCVSAALPAPSPKALPEDPNCVDDFLKMHSPQPLKTFNHIQRLLFHFHANEFGAGSKLEGAGPEALEYFHHYISSWVKDNPHPIVSTFAQKLQKAIELAKCPTAEHYVKCAHGELDLAFKNNTSLLIYGGWARKPGHAIYYEIIPEGNNKATFRLYNTGGGVENHNKGLVGVKIKYQPYLDWKGIDNASFYSPFFFKSLYELNNPSKLPSRDHPLNQNDIYIGLKKILKPVSEVAGEPTFLMSEQYSGICTIRGLLAALRTSLEMSDKEGYHAYRSLKCDMMLQSLHDATRPLINGQIEPTNKKMWVDRKIFWMLIHKSARKTARRVYKNFNKNIVNAAYLAKAKITLEAVYKWMATTENNIKTPHFQPNIPPLKSKKDPLIELFGQSFLNKQNLNLPSINTANINIIEFFKKLLCTNPLNINEIEQILTQDLQRISQHAWVQGADQALHTGLLLWIKNLPIDKDFWIRHCKDAKGAQNFISALGNLGRLFFQTCFTIPNAEFMQIERFHTLYRLQVIQTHLINFITQKNYDILHSDRLDQFFAASFSPQEAEEIKIRSSKIRSSKSNQILHSNSNFDDNNLELVQLRFSTNPVGITTPSPIIEIYEQFTKEMPEPLLKELVGVKDAKEHERYATLHSSNHLPDWLKTWRNTNLFMQWTLTHFFGRPTALNRNVNLDFEVEIRPVQEGTMAVFKLNSDPHNAFDHPNELVFRSHRDQNMKTHCFSMMHGQISSKPIEKLISYLSKNDDSNGSWKRFDEKALMIDYQSLAKDFGLSIEQTIALLRVFEDHSPVEALDYFLKHPGQLKKRDYRILFRIALFTANASRIHRLIHDNNYEGYIKKLALFLETQFNLNFHTKNFQVCAFLCQIQRFLRDFDAHRISRNNRFKDPLGNLSRLLARADDMKPEERSIIFAEFLAYFSNVESEKIQPVDRIWMLKGILQLKAYPIPKKWVDPIIENEYRKSICLHASHLSNYLVRLAVPDLNQLLNTLLKIALPNAVDNCEWLSEKTEQHSGPVFISSNKWYQYVPLTGDVFDLQQQTRKLPFEILSHPYFKKLFPAVVEATYDRTSNTYSFHDGHQNATRIGLNRDDLVIEQDLKEFGTVRYVPTEKLMRKENNKIHSYLYSRYLVEGFNHWQTLVNPKSAHQTPSIFICSPVNGSVLYQAEISDSTYKIIGLKNLSNHLYLSTAPSVLKDFEHPSYIHEWGCKNGDSLDIQKLELPRFSLTFTRQAGDQYVCDQIKGGYALVPHASVNQFHGLRHFLMVRNAQGKAKVILPKQDFKPSKESEVLQPSFIREKNLNSFNAQPQNYLIYDLSPSGHLIAHSLEANLYLAQLLTLVQNYDQAAYYLKTFCDKLIAYSEREAHILLEICTSNASKDITGDACALKTYAGYLLLKNNQSFKKDHKKVLPALKEAYTHYLKHYRNITCIHLKRNEELHVLSALFEHVKKDNSTSSVFASRIQMLNSSYIIQQDKKMHAAQPDKPLKIENTIRSMAHFINKKDSDIDFNSMNIVRFDLMENWVACYHLILRKNKQGLDWLHHVLCYLEASQKDDDIALSTIFRIFIKCKDSLPPAPKNTEGLPWMEAHQINNAWQTTICSFVNKAMRAESDVKSSKSEHSLKNYTSADFILPSPHDFNVRAPKISFTFPHLPILSCYWDELSKRLFSSLPITEMVEKSLKHNSAILWVEDQIKASKDELQIKTYEVLKKDFESIAKHPQSNEFQIKAGVNLKIISEDLSNGQKEAHEIISKLEKEIITIANILPEAGDPRVLEEIVRMGGIRKAVSLNDVLFAYARWKQDPAALKRKNPQMTDLQLKEVFEKTAHYLLLSSVENQRRRALNTLNELKAVINDRELEHELVQQLASDLMTKRCYKPDDHPEYLVFEHLNGPHGIFLRPEQIQKLESFLKDGNLNPIMEMIMGAGKSKVLLPLLAQLLAKPGVLVTLIVPESLFASVAGDTQGILMKTYGQPLKTIHFDRNTPITMLTLQTILNDLKTAREHCEPLIITNKTLQCLMLKCLELFDSFSKTATDGQPWTQEIHLMREILTCFSHSSERGCVAVVDEVDSVMNVLKKVCFSLGQQQAPKNHEVRTLLHLAKVLFTSKELKEIARWESDPKSNLQAPALTKEIYNKTFKRTLAEAFVHSFKELEFDSEEYNRPLRVFLESLKDKSNVNHLVNYLCHDQENNKTAQAYFNSQNIKIQEILRVAGQAIGQFLIHAMTRVLNQNYGIDKESGISIAVPFLATNVPSKGSQFANPHITMLYTILSILKEGVSIPTIQQEVSRLQSEAKVELAEKGNDELEKTKAYLKFRHLTGHLNLSFLKLKKADYETLSKHINSNLLTQCYFIEHIILPQMKLFSEQISCNPHNLVSFLKNVFGFTGTLWNEDNLNHSLKPLPAIGIGAKTYDLLFKKSREAIVSLNEGTTESMLQQLEKEKFDVVIDAGGYFKQDTNVDIARKIALHKQTPVVFYNHLGEQTITDGTKETALSQSDVSENARITFLDQDHTTGADIKYKRDAIGLVTIGRNTLERDLKQAVWRLRGLDKRQKVKFALSGDVRTLIRQASNHKALSDMQIRLDDIIHFTIVNQTQQLSRDNILSFTQQLWDIPQQLTFKLGLNDKISPKEFCKMWKSLRSRWITPGMHNASERYGLVPRMIKRHEFLEENQKNCMQFFETFYKSESAVKNEAYRLEIERLIKHMGAKLPSEILWPPYEDVEAAIEIEIHQEAQEEIEMEVHAEVQHIHERLGFSSGYRFEDVSVLSNQIFNNSYGPIPRFDVGLYMMQRPEMKGVAEYFKDIKSSLNIYAWPEETASLEYLSLYGPYRTPLVFVSVDRNQTVTILNQQDVKNVPASELFSLTSYFMSDREIDRSTLKKIVKVKFLNGDVGYNAQEQIVLAEWLNECNVEHLKDFMLKVVLAGRPEAFAAFQGSTLQKIFNESLKLLSEQQQKEKMISK